MKRKSVFLAVLSLVVALDQLTKYLTANLIDPFEPIEVLPFFNLVNVRNTGAAFGLFSSMGNVFFVAVTIAAVALLIFLIVREKDGLVGFTLILSGAVGNLIDRLALGHVRDFVDLHAGSHHWPAFNVADSALTVGIALILISPIVIKK